MSPARHKDPTHWVLLRGLTRDRRHWGSFPALLEAQLPDAQVHCVDLPGNGALWRERSPASVSSLLAACRRQLRASGVEPPYRLLAMSLGAMVAIEWATHEPEELQTAVLVNTSARPFNPFWQRLRPDNYGRFLSMLIAGSDSAAKEATVLRVTSRLVAADPRRRETTLASWAQWRSDCPVTLTNTARQLLAALRFSASRAPPRIPVLLVASAADGLVNPACSQRLAQAWSVPLVLHASAGHDLPLDDGPWLATAVANWSRQLPSGGHRSENGDSGLPRCLS